MHNPVNVVNQLENIYNKIWNMYMEHVKTIDSKG